MNKKLKNTATAHVAIKFMKHTARANTFVLTHKLPSKKNLLANSILLISAYMMSIVLFLFLVLYMETDTITNPANTDANIKRKENDRI
jgi:hypothetical protein